MSNASSGRALYKLSKQPPDVNSVLAAAGLIKTKPEFGRPTVPPVAAPVPSSVVILEDRKPSTPTRLAPLEPKPQPLPQHSPPPEDPYGEEQGSSAAVVEQGAAPEGIPATKIPQQYHKVKRCPILPPGSSRADAVFKDNLWNVTVFPSSKPDSRKEVVQLSAAFDQMLGDLKSGTGLELAQKEQEVYDAILHEITRQLYSTCSDRAKLLERVMARYRALFGTIPVIVTELQEEMDSLADTNRSLRGLLEKLMQEKSEIESQLGEKLVENSRATKALAAAEAELREVKEHLSALIDERDAAVAKAKQEQQQHYYLDRANRDLVDKAQRSKRELEGLTHELEVAANKLHAYEIKEISAMAPNCTATSAAAGPATTEAGVKRPATSAGHT